MPSPLPSQGRDLRVLWLASTISSFGSMLGALTLTALVYLHATPAQVGVLSAASTLPTLLFGALAGAWVDRVSRRFIMISCEVGQFAILITVPIATLADQLRVEHLYVVAFVSASFTIAFSLAQRAHLPSVVATTLLVEANSHMRMSEAVSETISPTLGGALVQAVSAPFVVFLDALTFLGSGLILSRLSSPAPCIAQNARPSPASSATDCEPRPATQCFAQSWDFQPPTGSLAAS